MLLYQSGSGLVRAAPVLTSVQLPSDLSSVRPHQWEYWPAFLSHSLSRPGWFKEDLTALSALCESQVSISELNILHDWKAFQNV